MSFNLDWHVDHPGIEINLDIWLIDQLFAVGSEATRHMLDQHKLRTDNLIRNTPGEYDWIAHFDRHEQIIHLSERFIYSSYLSSAWAVYESGLRLLAKRTREKREMPFAYGDFKGSDFIDVMSKYFRYLGLKLFDTEQRLQLVRLIYVLRCFVVHAGLAEDERADKLTGIEALKNLSNQFSLPVSNPEYSTYGISSGLASNCWKELRTHLLAALELISPDFRGQAKTA